MSCDINTTEYYKCLFFSLNHNIPDIYLVYHLICNFNDNLSQIFSIRSVSVLSLFFLVFLCEFNVELIIICLNLHNPFDLSDLSALTLRSPGLRAAALPCGHSHSEAI